MFFDRWRVEEDLERIKRRYREEFSEEAAEEITQEISEDSISIESSDEVVLQNDVVILPDDALSEPITEEKIKITAKDVLAMTIAVFSLLLPFIITLIVVIGLFLLFFFRNIIF